MYSEVSFAYLCIYLLQIQHLWDIVCYYKEIINRWSVQSINHNHLSETDLFADRMRGLWNVGWETTCGFIFKTLPPATGPIAAVTWKVAKLKANSQIPECRFSHFTSVIKGKLIGILLHNLWPTPSLLPHSDSSPSSSQEHC